MLVEGAGDEDEDWFWHGGFGLGMIDFGGLGNDGFISSELHGQPNCGVKDGLSQVRIEKECIAPFSYYVTVASSLMMYYLLLLLPQPLPQSCIAISRDKISGCWSGSGGVR